MKMSFMSVLVLMSVTNVFAANQRTFTDKVNSIRGVLGCYENSNASLRMIITSDDANLPEEERCEAQGIGHCKRFVSFENAQGQTTLSYQAGMIAQNPAIGSAFIFPLEDVGAMALMIDKVSYDSDMSVEALVTREYGFGTSMPGAALTFYRCK